MSEGGSVGTNGAGFGHADAPLAPIVAYTVVVT